MLRISSSSVGVKTCYATGFPNWETPDFIKDAAAKSVRDGNNQYCRSAGLPSFVNALANKYSAKLNRELDAMANIAVTVGVSGVGILPLIGA